jgi:hypothetical protein
LSNTGAGRQSSLLSSTAELLRDSLLLAGILRSPYAARIKSSGNQLLPALLDTKLFEDDPYGTKFAKSELEEIDTDEGSK